MPWNSNHHTKITKNIYAVMKSYRVLFFPYIFLLLNKTTGKRIQHQVYIEKAYPVYNQDIVKTLHRKGITHRKREGMLTDGSKLRWMKTIKALTEWIANWRHARQKKQKRTQTIWTCAFRTKQRGAEQNRSFHVKALFHRSNGGPCLFDSPSVTFE